MTIALAETVHVALWIQGADSEILGVYALPYLAQARCNAETDSRGGRDSEGLALTQEWKVER